MNGKQAKKKCPVCDWEIKDQGLTVKKGGREVVVCCEECAAKLREQPAGQPGKSR